MAKRFFYLFLLFYLFSFYADRKSDLLPDSSSLREELVEPPSQEEVDEEGYKFSYRGRDYYVEPKADYSMTGLVVSRNNISAFSDIHHTKDSVDFMDLCLIWGENTLNDGYLGVEFWSQPFSCWYQIRERAAAQGFDGKNLSNTHLLSADPVIVGKMASVRPGDQISVSGKLVDYAPALYPELKRKTSLVRGDTGNGACEVMMVENFRLLEEANQGWRKVLWLSIKGYRLFLMLSLIFFFKETYWPKRRIV